MTDCDEQYTLDFSAILSVPANSVTNSAVHYTVPNHVHVLLW